MTPNDDGPFVPRDLPPSRPARSLLGWSRNRAVGAWVVHKWICIVSGLCAALIVPGVLLMRVQGEGLRSMAVVHSAALIICLHQGIRCRRTVPPSIGKRVHWTDILMSVFMWLGGL